MPCCCLNILDLCKVGTCEGSFISLGVNTDQTGIHKLKVDFLNTEFTIEATLASGDAIRFPTVALNEAYVFIGQVELPNGSILTIEKDGTVYNCISFETQFQYKA